MPNLNRTAVDLIRPSIFARRFSKRMDCRVKPGNDALRGEARLSRRFHLGIEIGDDVLER
jgi:hypothetical protein